MRPTQLAERMKMKIVARNQNVRLTRCGPMMLSRKLYSPSTSHSKKFCAPPGTPFMSRVASWAKMINPTATIQLTTIELVIGKPKGRPIPPALLRCAQTSSRRLSSRARRQRAAVLTSFLVSYRSARDVFGSLQYVAFAGKFRFYLRYQLIIGRTGEDSVKLGAVVVHEADVFNYQVVDPPILSHLVKFIVDSKFLSLSVPHLTTHLSIAPVYALIRIDKFFVIVRLDLIHIGLLQQVAKDLYKLRLLFRGPALPVST